MLGQQFKNLNLNDAAMKDPLADVFQLENGRNVQQPDRINFGQLVNQSVHLQKFLGISPSYEIVDESALFGSPENMQINNQFDVFMDNAEDPGSAAPFDYGEDINNHEVFKDAMESPVTQDLADDQKMDDNGNVDIDDKNQKEQQ